MTAPRSLKLGLNWAYLKPGFYAVGKRVCQHCAKGKCENSQGFSEGKPEAAKPRGRSPRGFAAEGLPEENPEGALTLTRRTVSELDALSWGDSYSTLPQGFSTVAQTTKIMRFTGKWSQTAPYSKLLRPLFQTSAPAAAPIDQWEAQKLISPFTIVQCESLTLYLGAVWELVVTSSH